MRAVIRLNVIGSADVLCRLKRPDGGFIWEVDPYEPIGTEVQLDRLRSLLGVSNFVLYGVRDGKRGERLITGGTPDQNQLEDEVWVEYVSETIATIPIHPSLASFKLPTMIYIRLVSKFTKRGQLKMRILLLTTKSVYLLHPSGHTARWLRYTEIEEVICKPYHSGDYILVRATPPQHDFMFSLVDNRVNIPVHTTGDELTLIFHKSGCKVLPWTHDLASLKSQARLLKHKGYIKPMEKLKALGRAPLDNTVPSTLPENAANPTVPTGGGGLNRTDVEAIRGAAIEPVTKSITQQSNQLDSVLSEIKGLKQENVEIQKELRSARENEAANLNRQNLEFAKKILEATKTLRSENTKVTSPPSITSPPEMPTTLRKESRPPQSPEPSQKEPRRGIFRALLVAVTLNGEFKGNSHAVETSLQFLKNTGRPAIEVLSDAGENRLPTRVEVLRAFDWLLAGASEGDSVWCTIAAPSKSPEELMCSDNSIISISDLTEYLLSKVPDGVRLTLLLDCIPPLRPFLPYGLADTDEPLLIDKGRDLNLNLQSEIVIFSAIASEASTDSRMLLSGLLTETYLSSLMSVSSSITYKSLISSVFESFSRKTTSSQFYPTITSNFVLSHDSPVLLLPKPLPTPIPSPGVGYSGGSIRGGSASPQPQHLSYSAKSTLSIPLAAPFVRINESAPPSTRLSAAIADDEFWRNLVTHSFKEPTASEPPYAHLPSLHTGKEILLNKHYVAAFEMQWVQHHRLTICIEALGGRHTTQLLQFKAAQDLWNYLKGAIHELLGQRAVQKLLYPHAKDASRPNNLCVTVDIPGEEEICCNDQDWDQAVSQWESDIGFTFTRKTLPVPLMPPFKLEDRECYTRERSISDYIKSELSPRRDGDPKSVWFHFDTDFVSNLAYHCRIMPGARQAPLYVVEDSTRTHPLLVNQQFLSRYVTCWSQVHNIVVWVHSTRNSTLVAKCRVTPDFWSFLLAKSPSAQSSMGGEHINTGKGKMCRMMLTITCSVSSDSLEIWDGVWCSLIYDWESALPNAFPPWSPRRTRERQGTIPQDISL